MLRSVSPLITGTRACRGQLLDVGLAEGADHDPVDEAASTLAMSWIDSRLPKPISASVM